MLRFCLSKNIFDIPNSRSAHMKQTPRGGGVSIVLTFFIAVLTVIDLPKELLLPLVGSGFAVAAIGFWDDFGNVSVRWKLTLHFVAACWALYWLGGVSLFQFSPLSIYSVGLDNLIAIIFLVWLLNLFNFMDGIDGIAGIETIFVALSSAILLLLSGLDMLALILMILAASTTGFMFLNWPPAKIFMGDVSSCFLGLILGIIAYASINEGFNFWIWLILLGVFLVDSTLVLILRFLNGYKLHEAHCSHGYQNAARRWGHKNVIISMTLINCVWLFPFSYLCYLYPDFGMIFSLVALTPLIIIAKLLNAGKTIN